MCEAHTSALLCGGLGLWGRGRGSRFADSFCLIACQGFYPQIAVVVGAADRNASFLTVRNVRTGTADCLRWAFVDALGLGLTGHGAVLVVFAMLSVVMVRFAESFLAGEAVRLLLRAVLCAVLVGVAGGRLVVVSVIPDVAVVPVVSVVSVVVVEDVFDGFEESFLEGEM